PRAGEAGGAWGARGARGRAMPGGPSVAWAGVADGLVPLGVGVWGPAGTPARVRGTLHDAGAQALQAPEGAAGGRELGVETAPGSRADLGRFVTTETAKWKQVIETNHIKAE
ncbi:tripartite tricarboxylate transporter substrate binding protein, partial [Achromobacter ruhlandii]